MDLRFTAEEIAFRDQVRAFFSSALPATIREKMLLGRRIAKDELVQWQRILNAKGWATPAWPPAWGGANWTPVQQYIFKEELHRAPAPEPLSFNVNMVGPVLIAFGTEEQKAHFLPRVANLDYWFCQGFSEPGAGSDLASLRTAAVRDGDAYVINGQKIWTSTAHHADWMFCLVRTSSEPGAKKQMGITYLLIDMKTPGITVRPIITLDGLHETNEVFFDDVRVPAANRIGEENRGWHYAKFLLGNERGGQARVGISKSRIERAIEIAAMIPLGDGTLADDPHFQEKVVALQVELKALEITQMRVIAAQRSREGTAPDAATSVLKIKGTELQQATTELLMEVAGPFALAQQSAFVGGRSDDTVGPVWAASIAPNYFFNRSASIFGGTNEIQKNVIAKAVLGL